MAAHQLKRLEADKRPYRFTAYDWMKIEANLTVEIAASLIGRG